jgi:DNA-binding transcriptional regulator YiaG
MKKGVSQRILKRLGDFAETPKTTSKISEKYTCRTVKLNLEPQSYEPEQVRKMRRILNAIQRIFAEFLGVSVRVVQDWEQGLKPPHGSACGIMDEIRRNPQYWIDRLSIVREITVQCLLLIIPRSVMATLTRRQLFLERC